MGNKFQRGLYRFCRFLSTMVLFVMFQFRAYGQRNVPKRGGVLLLSNHQSFLDPTLMGCALKRPCAFMARDTLFTNPLLGAFLRSLNAFPVRRGTADRAAIRSAVDRLKGGMALVMFPEGTRTRDGEPQPFKGGFRFLAVRAGVPVVPVAIDGAFRAWPRSRLLPRPMRLRVMYGQPIPPDEMRQLSDEEVAARVAEEVAVMLRRLQRLP